MGTDIMQDDFLLRDLECQRDAVTVRDAYRVQSLHSAFESMQPEMRLQRVAFEIAQNLREAFTKLGMALSEFLG